MGDKTVLVTGATGAVSTALLGALKGARSFKEFATDFAHAFGGSQVPAPA